MRFALALLLVGLAASACQNDSLTKDCKHQYQHDYVSRGGPYDMGEKAYVKSCIDGTNFIGNEVNNQ